jgi:hypothetical protein
VHPGPTCGKDTLHQDDLGGTFGGPVWIPKLYNGKDKLFFFAGFQYHRYKNTTANTSAYVPTAANILARQLYGRGRGARPDLDRAPGTGRRLQRGRAEPHLQFKADATGRPDYRSSPAGERLHHGAHTESAIAGVAGIPASRLAYTLPAITDGSDICGHVIYSIPSQNFDKQFITRIDYTINAKNHLYGRYMLDSYQLPAYFYPNQYPAVTTQSGNPEQRVQTETIGEDHTFTSNLVNSAHVAALRRVNLRGYSLS